jgi:hypothetical protein
VARSLQEPKQGSDEAGLGTTDNGARDMRMHRISIGVDKSPSGACEIHMSGLRVNRALTLRSCELCGIGALITHRAAGMSSPQKYTDSPWIVVIALFLFIALAGGTIFFIAHFLWRVGQ